MRPISDSRVNRSRSRTDPQVQKNNNKMSHAARGHTEVNREAPVVNVYGVIYRLMCSGSQLFRELMIMRMKRKTHFY